MKKTIEAKFLFKENVYFYYTHLENELLKDYEKVTRSYMLNLIYKEIEEDPSKLSKYASLETINFLKKYIQEDVPAEFGKINELSREHFYNAIKGLLVYRDDKEFIYVVPNRLRKIILEYKPTVIHSFLDEFELFFKGLLLTKGILYIGELSEVYEKLKPKHMLFDVYEIVSEVPRFFVNFDPELVDFYGVFVINNFNPDIILLNYVTKFEYNWDMYLSIGEFGINRKIDILDKIYMKLIKNNEKEKVVDLLYGISKREYSYYFQDDEYYKREINKLINNEDESEKIFETLNNYMPTLRFKGDPLSEVDESNINMINQKFECPCGSGLELEDCCYNHNLLIENKVIFDHEEGFNFFMFLHNLLYELNKIHKVVKKMNLLEFMQELEEQDFQKLVSLLYLDPKFIDKVVRNLSFDAKRASKDEIRGFKHKIEGKFIAVKYIEQKLLMYNFESKNLFLVSGLSEPLSLKLPNDDLPVYIETKLIPLKDRIVYDSTFSIMPISIGPNITKTIEDEIKGLTVIRKFDDL